MIASPMPLEQILPVVGDNLYRVALLLGGEEKTAARLLLDLARRELRTWPYGDDEPRLVGALYRLALQLEQKQRRSRSTPIPTELPTLYRRILLLPLDQRIVVGLRLLLGYDQARLAAAGLPPEQLRSLYVEGLRALAPAARVQLSDYAPGELCRPLRDAIIDNPGRVNRESALRGHLAACAYCRSFDQGWVELSGSVEGMLRAQLRGYGLPDRLRERMLAVARPRMQAAAPRLRFALPPLIVLLLIAALVIPGFWRERQVVVERSPGAALDPRALVDQALAMVARPPERAGAVYRARYQTLWFFNEQTFAPMIAELWVDSDNPARHRLEVSHAEGGAPYELQLGDGRERLAYLIAPEYARATYGDLPISNSPMAFFERLDAAAQNQSRIIRLGSGVWNIGPSYLRDAARAADLRALGRQRDGEATVQILSYTGSSPLGRPDDAPGATAERVTVLLALDARDGRLRSATELIDPLGGGQSSRVTWRLVEEQWIISDALSRPVFDFSRAQDHTGIRLPALGQTLADQSLPLIRRRDLASPATLFTDYSGQPLWLPTLTPPGIDRALLIWEPAFRRREPPRSLVYLGAQRSLALHFQRFSAFAGSESERIGSWHVTITPERLRRYRLTLERRMPAAEQAASFGDPSARLLIEATGFSRAELHALIAGLQPFDLAWLNTQASLFVASADDDPAIQATLLALLQQAPQPAADRVLYERAQLFQRLDALFDPLEDPYHRPGYGTYPSSVVVEQWSTMRNGRPLSLQRVSDDDGRLIQMSYRAVPSSWVYDAYADALTITPSPVVPLRTGFSYAATLALGLLSEPGAPLLAFAAGAGEQLIARVTPVADSLSYSRPRVMRADRRPHLADLDPAQYVAALALDPEGAPLSYQVFAAGPGSLSMTFSRDGGWQINEQSLTLIESWAPVETRYLSLSEAPDELLTGAYPSAGLVNDFSASWAASAMTVRSVSFEEALREWAGSTYLLPADGPARPGHAELGELRTAQFRASTMPGGEAAAHGRAVRFAYLVDDAGVDQYLWISCGPAASLRAFFRSHTDSFWQTSRPLQVTIAGREVEGWLMSGINGFFTALFVEIDGTLIIAEGKAPWFETRALPLLADLQ